MVQLGLWLLLAPSHITAGRASAKRKSGQRLQGGRLAGGRGGRGAELSRAAAASLRERTCYMLSLAFATHPSAQEPIARAALALCTLTSTTNTNAMAMATNGVMVDGGMFDGNGMAATGAMGVGAGAAHRSQGYPQGHDHDLADAAGAAARLLVLCARAAPLALAPFGQPIADSVLPHSQMVQFPEPVSARCRHPLP